MYGPTAKAAAIPDEPGFRVGARQRADHVEAHRICGGLAHPTPSRSVGNYALGADGKGMQLDGCVPERISQLCANILGRLQKLGMHRKTTADIALDASQARIF